MSRRSLCQSAGPSCATSPAQADSASSPLSLDINTYTKKMVPNSMPFHFGFLFLNQSNAVGVLYRTGQRWMWHCVAKDIGKSTAMSAIRVLRRKIKALLDNNTKVARDYSKSSFELPARAIFQINVSFVTKFYSSVLFIKDNKKVIKNQLNDWKLHWKSWSFLA